jgi:glucoamylase
MVCFPWKKHCQLQECCATPSVPAIPDDRSAEVLLDHRPPGHGELSEEGETTMPRDIPVGNGKLLICFDKDYRIRDFYFPHVGQENHLGGDPCRFGIWVDRQFSWVGPEWEIDRRYVTDTLVTEVVLSRKRMGLRLTCHDAVDFHENIYLRQVMVENLKPQSRQVRLFFALNFNISGNSVGDTAAVDPKNGGIVHYKGHRYFLMNGVADGTEGLYQFAVGQKNTQGREGTYRDAEDGDLSGNAIAQGSVDSVVSLQLQIGGGARAQAYFWLGAGESWEEVRRLDAVVKRKSPAKMVKRTADYWRLWLHKETPPLDILSAGAAELYRRSLLILRTQMDWQGGIIAGNDSDVIQFNRDTYSYIWPRDGALVANALDMAGYPMPSQRFYQFVASVIEKEGYLLHKYNPDGTLASSWHPWLDDGADQLPIQEDETALVLWALWNHFVKYRDIEFIKPFYLPLVKRAAEFMCEYRDPATGLPTASYDLWEERRGIFSFTVGTIFGGLTAASLFCSVFGEEDKAARYRQAASEMRDGMSRLLWRADINRFCRGIYYDKQGKMHVDATCDASLWGLFAFGLYDVDDPRVVSTMAALRDALWLPTAVGGMARYENDAYHRSDETFPGNAWNICTLWLADFITAKATDASELDEALHILEWVAEHALPSGVLAEQVHPVTGEPLSVSPLTWSHATFVATCQRIFGHMARLKICPTCGYSTLGKVREKDWLEKLFNQTCDSIHGTCKV